MQNLQKREEDSLIFGPLGPRINPRESSSHERGRSKERRHLLSPDVSRCNSEERSRDPSRERRRSRSPSEPRKQALQGQVVLKPQTQSFFFFILCVDLIHYSILITFFQANTSDSPGHSASESSTPRSRRQLPQTPSRPRPYISYSPLVQQANTSSTPAGSSEGSAQPQDDACIDKLLKAEKDGGAFSPGHTSSRGHMSGPSNLSPHRYISEPYLPFHEDTSGGEARDRRDTLTFETAVATSLGRANAISSAPQLRHSWQVPNGHFLKQLGQANPSRADELLSDTDEDDHC